MKKPYKLTLVTGDGEKGPWWRWVGFFSCDIVGGCREYYIGYGKPPDRSTAMKKVTEFHDEYHKNNKFDYTVGEYSESLDVNLYPRPGVIQAYRDLIGGNNPS